MRGMTVSGNDERDAQLAGRWLLEAVCTINGERAGYAESVPDTEPQPEIDAGFIERASKAFDRFERRAAA